MGLFGLYGQLQLLGPIMERFGALEGDVGTLYSLENSAFFTTILLASGPLARVSRVRTALLGRLDRRTCGHGARPFTRIRTCRTWRKPRLNFLSSRDSANFIW